MNLLLSIKTFLSYAWSDFLKLPLSPRLPQFPSYILSYIDGRLAARRGKKSKARSFTFRLNCRITVSMEPEHFGMSKGILIDREYFDLPLADEPKRILDLGANIGMGLIALHDQFPQADFAGVEADPRNFPLLLTNLSANNIKASLLSAAVFGEPDILSLRIGSSSTCSTLIDGTLLHSTITDTVDIPCLTMPQVLEWLGWPCIDLLKVDIEGAEESLFSHSSNWLHNVQSIVLEIHPNTTPEKIQNLLSPFGFRLRRHSFGNEPVFFADRS